MRLGDLAVVVLEEIGAVAVEHAGYAAVEARGVGAGRDPAPRRFDAEHRDLRDRKSVVSGKRVSVRVDLGGRRIIKTTKTYNKLYITVLHLHSTDPLIKPH